MIHNHPTWPWITQYSRSLWVFEFCCFSHETYYLFVVYRPSPRSTRFRFQQRKINTASEQLGVRFSRSSCSTNALENLICWKPDHLPLEHRHQTHSYHLPWSRCFLTIRKYKRYLWYIYCVISLYVLFVNLINPRMRYWWILYYQFICSVNQIPEYLLRDRWFPNVTPPPWWNSTYFSLARK